MYLHGKKPHIADSLDLKKKKLLSNNPDALIVMIGHYYP